MHSITDADDGAGRHLPVQPLRAERMDPTVLEIRTEPTDVDERSVWARWENDEICEAALAGFAR